MNKQFKIGAIATAVTSVFSTPVLAEDSAADKLIERVQIIGQKQKLKTESGSATFIGEEELAQFKFDDINRVLYSIPGVNIREEDGFGLRPNIGFRGVTPERSKKITIMEDGVLIGPAPYSAPAAYYFPMMTKINSLEVFKGPSAIKYGPFTVAGALNLTTRPVPSALEGAIDLSVGSNGYQKIHGYAGDTHGKFGYLVEAAKVKSDGFKELDGGGDTGFDKNDIMAKFQYDFSTDSYNQIVELKIDYADEVSNETYLGLTDADFKQNPNRRYTASQKDKMDWDHQQVMLTHFIGNDDFDVTTKVYRHDFKRSWFKINGLKRQGGGTLPALQNILAEPERYEDLLRLLKGEIDSSRNNELIILGDNNRKFYSQGIQSELYWYTKLAGLKHSFNIGARFHQDQIQRRHTEDSFLMTSSQLVSDGIAQVATSTNLEETDAISIFIKDTISYKALDVTVGVRGEFIDAYFQNQAPSKDGDWQKKSTQIWLPSLSAFYKLSDNSGVFFGIHEGFVPSSPKQPSSIKPENSINYELGGRYNNGNTNLEATVFFNDIENLIETCGFSNCGQDDEKEFNSGKASVAGLELTAGHTFTLNSSFDLPVSLAYTYTKAKFDTAFESAFPQWGNVKKGDKLPYTPENQLTLKVGIQANDWGINAIGRYIDSMQEASGEGVLLSGVETDALSIVDLSANYSFDKYGVIYLKVDNVFDKQEIVSRRPYGARPSKARQAFVGYQYQF
ncbi:TonB-dependent receptor [Parashewanella curva]|uniref:TonB-dependent receptor n=1 Tax=Parashewanella curva TaxID=2338552 RepID=A0A3L8PYG3_9GAMM|nr:TonB-dependent receptor [Parashewanella curva]RLV60305.1 TonB-dependent receptor [Parashewanella curva]